uniref:Transmembrane protein 144 n=1 Tax=Caenorhabditis tropicalis TaxID=1561998 RepID=A0A1I7UTV0_9PELO
MEKDTSLGIICAVVSAITFGSTYVPLKWFHKGDGLYFQWIQSIGQLLVGVTVALTTSPAPIHPIAMLSGMFYSVGNSLTVFIMDGIGLAIGYLLWNTVTCVVGWAVTRFGLFANPQQPQKVTG